MIVWTDGFAQINLKNDIIQILDAGLSLVNTFSDKNQMRIPDRTDGHTDLRAGVCWPVAPSWCQPGADDAPKPPAPSSTNAQAAYTRVPDVQTRVYQATDTSGPTRQQRRGSAGVCSIFCINLMH